MMFFGDFSSKNVVLDDKHDIVKRMSHWDHSMLFKAPAQCMLNLKNTFPALGGIFHEGSLVRSEYALARFAMISWLSERLAAVAQLLHGLPSARIHLAFLRNWRLRKVDE